MIKVGDKYKIIKKYRNDILTSLGYDDIIDDNIVNKEWEIFDIDDIYKNKDLSYFKFDEIMFTFKCENICIGIYLSEVQKIKKKLKNNNQIRINI